MKVHRIVLLAVVVIWVSSAVTSEGQAGGATPVTACGQLVTTDAFLTQDLYCPGSHGVVVAASGITVDLKGFTVRGDRTLGTNGVDDAGGFDGVTIKNGVVRNFDYGVFAFNGTDKVSVSGVLASGNATSGIVVGGASAAVKSSSGSGNSTDGIHVEGDSATIQSSTASGNGNHGIYVSGAFALVKSSTASGNKIDGILVNGASGKVQSAFTSGNGNAGIEVSGASGLVKSSTASGNRNYGLAVIGDTPTVVSSTASGNPSFGIVVNGDTATIKSSTASGNGGPGIFVSSDTALVDRNRTEGNGFSAASSDLSGLGISVAGTAPTGKNVARGNDDPAECNPAALC